MLVIAHQFPRAFEVRIANALPQGSVLKALPPDRAWDVPEDATVLLAVPSRGERSFPANPPPGWPRNLKWLQAASSGVDEYPKWIYDVPVVTCGRGTNSAVIAEFVLAALLAVAKKLPDIWISSAVDWKLAELGTLKRKTLGLIGYGSIGQAVAALAKPFGMEVIATSRSANSGIGAHGARLARLDEVLALSDHLVIALPLTAATEGLIGRAALSRVKPGAHLVNISRGRVVDHEALLDALNSGGLGFASLDVTEPEPLPAGHPLYTHPHVHLSPHLSWSTGERSQALAAFLGENLRRYLAGEALAGVVNAEWGY